MRAIAIKKRNIPAEIVEEILLNLPVKSLLRFSSVSHSWNSIIFGSWFVKRYGSRSRSRSRQRIAFTWCCGDVIKKKASSCLISSIPSPEDDATVVDTTDFDCPLRGRFTISASCGDLWLAKSVNPTSLFLWNPSMGTYKQVPYPNPNPNPSNKETDVFFGLGYEGVADDYKILRISIVRTTMKFKADLYSLRSGSWRNIEDFPTNIRVPGTNCAFLSGKLHLAPSSLSPPPSAITCFDILTEKFEEVALPNYSVESQPYIVDVRVLRGMLCLSINYPQKYCHVWVMEEYGVAQSWTKKFSIAYFGNPVSNSANILPMYLYDNGEILVRFSNCGKIVMFVYNEDDKSAREVKINSSSADNHIDCRFLYVDSLVAPAMHAGQNMN